MNENTVIIGIDNGIAGGISFFRPENNNLFVLPMPIVKAAKDGRNEYDIPAIVNLLKNYKSVKMVILEKDQPYPGIGATAVFTNGRNYGIMEGILVTMGLPYMVVHPKTWQKKMFEGMPYDDTKKASILTAKRLFPSISFKATEKTIIDHHGMTDSALMAVYGSITYGK